MIERLRDSVGFSIFIRFLLLSSGDLLLFAWFELKYVRLTQTKWETSYEVVSSCMSIIYIAICLILFVSMPFLIAKLSKCEKVFVRSSRQKFGCFVNGYDLFKRPWKMYYYSFYLGTRIVASILYVHMYDSPKVVLSVLISIQGLQTIYITISRPYYNGSNNIWPILMEVNTLVILMLMIVYMDENTSAQDKENCNFAIVALVFSGITFGMMKYILNHVRAGRPQIGVDPTQDSIKSDVNKTQDNINKENSVIDLDVSSYSAVSNMKEKDIDLFLDDDLMFNKRKKRGFDYSSNTPHYKNPNDISVLRAEELAYDYSNATATGTPIIESKPSKNNKPSITRTPPLGDEVLKFHYSLRRKDKRNH